MPPRRRYDPKADPKKAGELAKQGLFNDEIAAAMGINRGTLYEWQAKHTDFADALKAGQEPINRRIEASLFALTQFREDVEVIEELVTTPLEVDGETVEVGTYKVTKRVTRQVAPVPSAVIFALKNRLPLEYRDKTDIEHSGQLVINVNPAVHAAVTERGSF